MGAPPTPDAFLLLLFLSLKQDSPPWLANSNSPGAGSCQAPARPYKPKETAKQSQAPHSWPVSLHCLQLVRANRDRSLRKFFANSNEVCGRIHRKYPCSGKPSNRMCEGRGPFVSSRSFRAQPSGMSGPYGKSRSSHLFCLAVEDVRQGIFGRQLRRSKCASCCNRDSR